MKGVSRFFANFFSRFFSFSNLPFFVRSVSFFSSGLLFTSSSSLFTQRFKADRHTSGKENQQKTGSRSFLFTQLGFGMWKDPNWQLFTSSFFLSFSHTHSKKEELLLLLLHQQWENENSNISFVQKNASHLLHTLLLCASLCSLNMQISSYMRTHTHTEPILRLCIKMLGLLKT